MIRQFLRGFFIGFLLILEFGCLNSEKGSNWYLIGSNGIQLTFNHKILQITQNKDLIFKAKINEIKKNEDSQQFYLTLEKVGNLVQKKYKPFSQMILWLYFQKDHQKLKLIMNNLGQQETYQFTSDPQLMIENQNAGRFLVETEIKNYNLQPTSNNNICKNYFINIETSAFPQMTPDQVLKAEASGGRRWMRNLYKVPSTFFIGDMMTYLTDLDPSTGFITKEEVKNLKIQYALEDPLQKLPINHNVSIRGFQITAGNLNNKSAYRKYRRPKKISIFFAQEYTGGLGIENPNFNEARYDIILPDDEMSQIYVFYRPVKAKVILLMVDSYYMGESNEMSIFDFVPFTDNN